MKSNFYYKISLVLVISVVFLCPAVFGNETKNTQDELEKYMNLQGINTEYFFNFAYHSNQELLTKIFKGKPCIPQEIINSRSKKLAINLEGDLFQSFYSTFRGMFTDAELVQLNEFYSQPIGKFFIKWKDKTDSLPIPVLKEEDRKIVKRYKKILDKEGEIIATNIKKPSAILDKKMQHQVSNKLIEEARNIKALFLDTKGNCPQ